MIILLSHGMAAGHALACIYAREELQVLTSPHGRHYLELVPLAHGIADACRIFGIGRTQLYKVIADSWIEGRKLGSKKLIPAASLRASPPTLPVAPVGPAGCSR